LNLQHDLVSSSKTSHLPNTRVLAVENKPANRQHRVVLEKTDRDFSSLLEKWVVECEAKNSEVIYLDIPLDDQAVNEATELAKKCGFIFGTLMVDRRGSDRLSLHGTKVQ
jgi:hypothetical protein